MEKGKGIRVWGSVAGGGYWEGDRGRFSRRGGGGGGVLVMEETRIHWFTSKQIELVSPRTLNLSSWDSLAQLVCTY